MIISNVFEAIRIYGHDEDYRPNKDPNPTPHAPGSIGKLLELTSRLERGEALHHPGRFPKTSARNGYLRSGLREVSKARKQSV